MVNRPPKHRTARGRRRDGHRVFSLEVLEERRSLTLDFQFTGAVGVVSPGAADIQSNAVANDALGNVYVTGSLQGTANFNPNGVGNLSSTGNRDTFVAAYSAQGALNWAETLRGANGGAVGQGSAIAVDGAGNVYLAGTFSGTVNFDPGAGSTTFSASTRNDIFIEKLAPGGRLLWVKDIHAGLGDLDEPFALAVDGAGNVYAGGSFQESAAFGSRNLTASGTFDSFVSKLDSSGNFLWTKTTAGSGTATAQTNAIAIDGAGNVLTTGFFTGTVNFNPSGATTNLTSAGSRDIFVQKLDASGNLVWAEGFGGADIDQGNGIAADGSGNVYVTGTFSFTVDFNPGPSVTNLTAGGYNDAFILKLDAAGGMAWAKDLNGSTGSSAQGTGIGIDGAGNVDAAGYFTGAIACDPTAPGALLTSQGSDDVFVSQFDGSGHFLGARGAGGNNFDAAFGIGVNPAGNVALTGRYTGPASFGSFNLPAVGSRSFFVAETSAPVSVPAPGAPVLEAASDSGVKGDNLTNVTSPVFDVTGAGPALTVQLFRDGVLVNGRSGSGAVPDPGPVPEGVHTYTARLQDASNNTGPFSSAVTVTIDTQAPAAPGAFALAPADDSGTKGDGVTNVTQPQLVGTALAGTVVLVRNNGTVLGSATASADGTYLARIASPLSDGTYQIQVQAVDAAGNISAPSPALSLTILTAPPATPAAPTLAAADDSGVPGDGITSVQQPHLSGSSVPGDTIQLLSAGGGVLGSSSVATDGTYSARFAAPLSDGTYAVRVQAVDVAGNTSAPSPAFSLTILSVSPAAPSAPMLASADDSGVQGDGITNIKQPHLTGSATAGITVQLLDGGGKVLGSAAAVPGGSYSVSTSSPLGDGTYSVRAQAVDVAGNTSVPSAAFALTILTAAPSAPSAPALFTADDSGISGDGITNVVQPRIVGNAPGGDTVLLLDAGGIVLASMQAAVSGRYTLQFPGPLSDGTYPVRVKAVDVAGNTSPASPSFRLTILTTPPPQPAAPLLAAGDDSGVKGDNITNVNPPHLIGTAAPGTTVLLIGAGGSNLGTATAASDGSYTVQFAGPLRDGTYPLRVQAVDVAGNASSLSSTENLTILTVPPSPPSTPALAPADDSGVKGDGITNVAQPRLIGTATAGVTIQLINGVGTVLGSGASAADGTYAVQFATSLIDGSYAVRARAIDVAGNVSTASGVFTLTVSTGSVPAPSAPTLAAADDSGAQGDGITNVIQPHLVGTAGPGLIVRLLNASGNVLGTATVAAAGTFSIQVAAPLPDGAYAISAQAVSASGTPSAPSSPFTLTILTTAPAAPGAPALAPSDDSGVQGDGITNVQQPRLVGVTAPKATVLLLGAGGNRLGTATAAADGSYSVPVTSPFADGLYSLRAQAVDVAGNASPASPAFALTILSTPPATPSAPALAAADDSGAPGDGITNVKQPRLVGSTAPGVRVQLLDGHGAVFGTAAAAGDGSYSVSVANSLADGTYSLQVRVTDVAGNVSAPSPAFNLTILSAPPATPTTPLLSAADDSGVKGDGITNVRQPRLVGTSVPGDVVQLLGVSGAVLGSATAAGDGSYTVALASPFSDGTYAVRAATVDVAGNVSPASPALSLIVLATAPATPQAPALAPSDDSGSPAHNVTGVNQPHLFGKSVAGATIQLLGPGGANFGSATAGGDGAYTIQVNIPLADGTYAVQVQAIDVAGNTSGSSPAFTLIVNTAPALPPTAPLAPTLAPTANSGPVGDNLTRYNGSPQTPLVFVVSGVSPPGGFVRVFDVSGATPRLLAGPVQAVNGTATLIVSNVPLADGAYRIAATGAATAQSAPSALSPALGFTIQTSLRVVAVSPAEGSWGASLPGGQVVVTFNHPLQGLVDGNPASFAGNPFAVMLLPRGPSGVFSAPSGYDSGIVPVDGTLNYHVNPDGTSRISFTPTAPLVTDVYAIGISGGLSDLAGNPLSDQNGNPGGIYKSFLLRPTPYSPVALQVTSVSTENGSVPINNNVIPQPDTIAIAFNKPLASTLVNSATFQLIAHLGANYQPVPSVVAYSPSTQSVYLTPAALLVPGTAYIIAVDGSVTDDLGFPGSGFPLGAPFYSSFTVSAAAAAPDPGPLRVVRDAGNAPVTLPVSNVIWPRAVGYASVAFTGRVSLASLGRYAAMLIPLSTGVAPGSFTNGTLPVNDKLAFNPNTNQLIIVPTVPLNNDLYVYSLGPMTGANPDGSPNPNDPLIDTEGGPLYSSFLLQASTPVLSPAATTIAAAVAPASAPAAHAASGGVSALMVSSPPPTSPAATTAAAIRSPATMHTARAASIRAHDLALATIGGRVRSLLGSRRGPKPSVGLSTKSLSRIVLAAGRPGP